MTTESDIPQAQMGEVSHPFTSPMRRSRARDLDTSHMEAVGDRDSELMQSEMDRHPAGGSSDDRSRVEPRSQSTLADNNMTANNLTANNLTVNETARNSAASAVFDIERIDPAVVTRGRRVRGYERVRSLPVTRTRERATRSAPRTEAESVSRRPGQIGSVSTTSVATLNRNATNVRDTPINSSSIDSRLAGEQVAIGKPGIASRHQRRGPSGSSSRRQVLRTSPQTLRAGSRRASNGPSDSRSGRAGSSNGVSTSLRRSLIDFVGLSPSVEHERSATPIATYESARNDRPELHVASGDRVFEKFIDPRLAKRRASVARQSMRDGRRPYVISGVLLIIAVVVVGIAFSPLFAVRQVSITGAGARRDAIARVANVHTGTPMLRIDVSAIQKQLAALPEVEAVRVERDWPTSIRIYAVVRQPIVAMRSGATVSLVAKDGTVLRNATSEQNLAVSPTQWSDVDGVSVPLLIASPGVAVGEKAKDTAGQMVTVLGHLDPLMRPRVQYVERIDNDLILTLSRGERTRSSKLNGVRVNLGANTELELKAKALKAVLSSNAFDNATAIDLSVPDVPVVKTTAS